MWQTRRLFWSRNWLDWSIEEAHWITVWFTTVFKMTTVFRWSQWSRSVTKLSQEFKNAQSPNLLKVIQTDSNFNKGQSRLEQKFKGSSLKNMIWNTSRVDNLTNQKACGRDRVCRRPNRIQMWRFEVESFNQGFTFSLGIVPFWPDTG
jgi:hypothetical protein